MRIKCLLKRITGNSGFSYTFICVLMIMLLMISLLIWEYIRLSVIVSNVREKIEDSLVVIATDRYDEMYAACRDGYAATFEYNGSYWTNSNKLSISEIESEILHELNSGEKIQINSVKVLYFTITFNQMGYAAGNTAANSGIRFKVSGRCRMNIPFKLLWSDNFNVTVDAETQWISLY